MPIQGEAKLMAQLKALQKLNTIEARKAFMSVVFDRSQELVPVDTGALKDSGKLVETDNSTQIVYDAPHALPIEFGTIKMQAQPFLRPAFEETQDAAIRAAAEEIEKEIKEKL